MASKIVGITVDIEGKTSGLTKSLQEANSSINKTTSALKDVDKALKLDPTNVELLAQKEALLTKQIEQTNEKLEIMKKVAEDANDALARGDISQEQYASLTAEISRTEVALGELQSEAEGSADSLEDTGDAAEDAGGEVEESSEAFEALGEAAEMAGEVAVAALEAVVVAAAAVGAAVTAAMVEAGTALTNATMDTSKLADELLTMSSTTGLSTDTLQELNYASELLDVDTQTVTGSMTKLLKTMSSAADGNASAAEKFEELGISIYDAEGNIRSTEDVFWDAIDTLGSFSSETERDMAAMDLFGKSARELNPLIEAGSDSFRSLAEEAKSVGYVMDGETLDAFGALDDNMQRLSNTAQAVEQSFGQVLLPLLTDMSGDAVSLMGDFSGALASAGGDIDQIGSIIEQFAPQAVAMVEKYVPKILTVIQQVLNALLPAIIAVAPQLITMIGQLIQTLADSIASNAESFISAFSTLFESIVSSVITLLPVLIPLAIDLIMTLVNALMDNAPLLLDGALSIIMTLCDTLLAPENVERLVMAATEIITGLLGGLTQAMPVLIPAAINAIMTLVSSLLSPDCIGQIIGAALTLIVTLASALIEALPQLIARLPEIILGIVQYLCGDGLQQIIEAGFTLLTALITNLPDIIVAVVGGLIELVAGMVEYFTGDGMDDLIEAGQTMFDGIINLAASWGSDLIDQFIDGIMQMWENLKSTLNSVAELVKNILGFSVPEEGPLHEWAYKNPGEDMLKLYSEGIERGMTDFEDTLFNTAAAINRDIGGMNLSSDIMVNRTDSMSALQESIGQSGGTWVFPIYLGGELLDTVVLDALDRANYRAGGH